MLQHRRIAAVPHGFRSSFQDGAAEKTDHPREVIEAALAHVVQNKVEAASIPGRTCSSVGGGSWTIGRGISTKNAAGGLPVRLTLRLF